MKKKMVIAGPSKRHTLVWRCVCGQGHTFASQDDPTPVKTLRADGTSRRGVTHAYNMSSFGNNLVECKCGRVLEVFASAHFCLDRKTAETLLQKKETSTPPKPIKKITL